MARDAPRGGEGYRGDDTDGEEYKKDFDGWNEVKKQKNAIQRVPSFREREVWLICLGVNVGSEIDGTGKKFCRPAVILHKKDRKNCIILPMSRSDGDGRSDYYEYKKNSFVVLGQIRTVSAKRLVRKMYTMSPRQYKKVVDALVTLLSQKHI